MSANQSGTFSNIPNNFQFSLTNKSWATSL